MENKFFNRPLDLRRRLYLLFLMIFLSVSLLLEAKGQTLTGCGPEISLSNPRFPNCAAYLGGRIATEEDVAVENVTVVLDGYDRGNPPFTCSTSVLTTDGFSPGRYGFCPVCVCNDNTLTPSHDVNPLNGVSTYDLVLISKHILGLEPLPSPYRMIAADANESGSITTFDIVEFRKLILGIFLTGKLPVAPSWRFVDKSFAFPDPNNPFKTIFPENITVLTPQQNWDFVAIKVGDVNASATTSSRPVKRPEVGLSWTANTAQTGTTLTLPVTYTGDLPAEAIQLGLRFDPARLALIGPSKGTLPGYGEGNFNLNNAAKGEIRTLWIPDFAEPDRWVQPGDVLFYLTFKVLSNATSAEPLISLDNALLENLAWTPEGQECTIAGAEVKQRDGQTLPEVSATSWLKASCTPNPTSGTAALNIQSTTAGKARVWLFNAAGGRVLMRDVVLSADTPQDVALPEVAQLPAGVYLWKVAMSGERVEGRLVKE